MTFEVAGERPQLQQILNGHMPDLGPRRVQQRRGVTLREDEAIVVGVLGVLGIKSHAAKKQRRHDVGGGAAGGRMPRAGFGGGVDGMDAQSGCNVFQSGKFIGCSHGGADAKGCAESCQRCGKR